MSKSIVEMFVEDVDGLLGRVVQENADMVTVVREGDAGTLEEFAYARSDLTVIDEVVGLFEHDPNYVASLFTIEV
jgi:hypothetical protein